MRKDIRVLIGGPIVGLIVGLIAGLIGNREFSHLLGLIFGREFSLVAGLIFGLTLGLILGLIGTLHYPGTRIAVQPKETAYVTVKRIKSAVEVLDERLNAVELGKQGINEAHLVTFEFPNGSEKEFELSLHSKYKVTEVNVSGMLTYKERKNATSYKDRIFLKFE